MSVMLAIGNAFDGIRLVGPFEDADEATAYAELRHDGAEWTLVPYDDPVYDDEGDIEPTAPTPDAREGLDEIHALLNGVEWSADTISDVADVLYHFGYTIEEPS